MSQTAELTKVVRMSYYIMLECKEDTFIMDIL